MTKQKNRKWKTSNRFPWRDTSDLVFPIITDAPSETTIVLEAAKEKAEELFNQSKNEN